MDHENMKMRLFDLLDGELGRDEAEQVKKHLEICQNCREDAESWQTARKAFTAGFAVPVPTGFSERVMMKIQERKNFAPKFSLQFLFELLSLPRWEALATAACFFAVLSYFFIDRVQAARRGAENPIAMVYHAQESSLLLMAPDGAGGEESEEGIFHE